MPKIDEKVIANHMKKLGITREEAIELILDDDTISHMKPKEVNDDLSDEQKKVVKAMKNSDTKTRTAYKFTKRERKKDELKAEIVGWLANFLRPLVSGLEVTNEEREITFTRNGEHFTLTLVKNRPKKSN